MTTTTVSSASALMSALSSAKAGDTIALTAGTYSNLSLNGLKFSSQVTITSADSSHPASLVGLQVGGSSGLTFQGLQLQYSSSLGNAALVGGGSSNIVFNAVDVSGTGGAGNGLFLRDSSNITVTNSNIHDLQDGIAHLNMSGLTITNTQFHDMSNDGIRGGGSSNVTISGNTFTNFHSAEYAHNDAIQFWTINTTTSAHDITITNNTMLRGNGNPIQGILMGNDNHLAFQNVTISGNKLIGEAYEGIHVDQATNLVMSNNLVEGYKDMSSWIEVINSSNATLSGNVASSWIFANNSGITQTGNQTVALSTVGDLTDYNSWLQSGSVQASSIIGAASSAGGGSSSATGSSGAGAVTVTPPITPTAPTTPTGGSGTSSGVTSPPPVVSQPTPSQPAASQTLGDATTKNFVGGAGNDSIHGNDLGNNIQGGLGNDTIVCGNGMNAVVAGAGDDSIVGGTNYDDINGNAGNDTIDGGASGGGDWLFGGQGNDVITVHTGHNGVMGNIGNDTLYGGSGADTLWGGQGNDLIVGGKGDNLLSGDLGNDTLVAGSGWNTMTGGAGADVFKFTKLFSAPATVTDFTHGQDKIDLHSLLGSYKGSDPVADGWVKLSVAGGATTIFVDVDGPSSSANGFVAVAKLQGVTSMTSADWIL